MRIRRGWAVSPYRSRKREIGIKSSFGLVADSRFSGHAQPPSMNENLFFSDPIPINGWDDSPSLEDKNPRGMQCYKQEFFVKEIKYERQSNCYHVQEESCGTVFKTSFRPTPVSSSVVECKCFHQYILGPGESFFLEVTFVHNWSIFFLRKDKYISVRISCIGYENTTVKKP